MMALVFQVAQFEAFPKGKIGSARPLHGLLRRNITPAGQRTVETCRPPGKATVIVGIVVSSLSSSVMLTVLIGKWLWDP